MPLFSLALLGPLQVARDDAPVASFESDKVRALLFYLAVEAERPHRRSALAGLLWPDRPERAALLNLNQALANLRRAIGDREAEVPLLLISRESLQFNRAAPHTLDLAEFEALLAACQAHTHRNPLTCAACATRHEQALALYRGPFLAQFEPRDSLLFQEWAVLVRERAHRRALEALEALIAYHEQRHDEAAALAALARLLELDPWREEAHRQAMRLLWRTGQRSVALAQYERCRAVLVSELGVEPEDATIVLYEQIRDGELSIENEVLRNVGARENAANAKAAVSQCSMLNAQLTPFLGRQAELAQLAEYLTNPGCRLITIVGLGGAGKTRLALQAAHAQRAIFADGVCVVPLAAIESPALLLPIIAEALGLALASSQELTAQLAAHLRERELLLVLDNLEQLREGISVLTTLLERAPRLTILATSRERLQLRGEWVLELGGLALPERADAATLETSSASALFLQAAQRANGQFVPARDDQQAIVQICQLLAGHPLAIELAAAWAHLLSCGEIAAELVRSLELLVSTNQDVPERQRTLQTVLDSSWRLLALEEARALRQLAVFRGGFRREAAAAVAGVGLPLLVALINRSWLQRGGDGRYQMHEFVRQYAVAQLHTSGEAAATRTRHLANLLALAEQAEPHFKSSAEKQWLDQLASEHDNLRAALEYALEAATPELIALAARTCAIVRWFWYMRGHFAEARSWLERLLVVADTIAAPLDSRLRGRILQANGIFADEQGNYARAEVCYREALQLYSSAEDSRGVQVTSNSLGILLWGRGEYGQAQGYFEASLRLCQELGNDWGAANSLNSLGTALQAQGALTEALRHYEQALTTARAVGHDALATVALDNIGEVALVQGEYAQALGAYSEALARQRAENDTRGVAHTLQGLGLVALAQGNLGAAERQLGEGLRLSWQSASRRDLAAYLDHSAALLAAQGHYEHAAQLCAATESLRAQIGTTLTPFEQARHAPTLAAIRTHLPEYALATAWAAGRATPLEQLIGELLDIYAVRIRM